MVKHNALTRDQTFTLLAQRGYRILSILRCVEELIPIQTEPVELFDDNDVEEWIDSNSPATPNPKNGNA